MQRCMRCGSEFRTPADHDRSECRRQIIVGLTEQIFGQRTTIHRLGRKIHGQRKRLRDLETAPKLLADCSKAKAELQQKYDEGVGVIKQELEQVQDALRIEQETRQQSIEFARADFVREQLAHEETKKRWQAASSRHTEAVRREQEALSQLAASTDKVQELFLANRMIESARKAASTAEVHWREEANKANRELRKAEARVKELEKQNASLGSELSRRMVNKVFGEKNGFSTLYYCGCEHIGKGAPIFCPLHHSPQTREGLLDGR